MAQITNEQITQYFKQAIDKHPEAVLKRLKEKYPSNLNAYFRGNTMNDINKKLMLLFLVRRAINSGNAVEFIKSF